MIVRRVGWLVVLCSATLVPLLAAGSAGLGAPSRLRVGLATDLESVMVPCCTHQIVAESADRVVALVSSLKVEPAAEILTPSIFRLQVAALKDEQQAIGLATRLKQAQGEAADVVFDAGTDLYRVRIGQYITRAEAEAAQRRLTLSGVAQSWIVTEKGALGRAELKLTQGDRVVTVPGRWLTLRADGESDGLRIMGERYRGEILVYLNDRGLLNVINELSIEEYLRGVVPREMGPAVYDSLEALKAQTVAARTYTLRNLGEFSDEGYDICATPRCQVYGGMAVEHPLTDRAIAETTGEVLLYGGEPVEALYSSTCGGHTEDVELIFPLKRAPYLKGVACLEAGVDRLAGTAPKQMSLAQMTMLTLLPPAGTQLTPAVVGGRLEHLALLAGLPIPRDRLATVERREVQRFIASIFDLALDARLFVAAEDLPYLIEQPPGEWTERDLRLAAYLKKSGLLAGELDEPLTAAEIEETLFRLALYLRVLDQVDGRYMSLSAGEIAVRASDGELRRYRLSSKMATYRRAGDRRVASALALLAGDRVDLYMHAGEVLALSHETDSDGVAFDRTSNFSSWSRFRSDGDLTKLVQERYPGLGFRSFEILSRGVSGRVGKIRLIGEGERSVVVEGLAVRWTLDLPDTLFTAKRLTPPSRAAGWLFSGRGWGHGVGLCQVGAYGMAQRGHGYREILQHYYSGVEILQVWGEPAAQVPAAP